MKDSMIDAVHAATAGLDDAALDALSDQLERIIGACPGPCARAQPPQLGAKHLPSSDQVS